MNFLDKCHLTLSFFTNLIYSVTFRISESKNSWAVPSSWTGLPMQGSSEPGSSRQANMSRITSLSKHSLRTLQLPLVIPKRVSYAKSQFFNDGNKVKNLKCGERWNATFCHKQGCITCPSHDKLAKKKITLFHFPNNSLPEPFLCIKIDVS